jgi:hypothetical protein
MRHRCVQCTDSYRIGDSSSIYPQSFCSKACEVEAVVMDRSERSFSALLQSLGMQTDLFSEIH